MAEPSPYPGSKGNEADVGPDRSISGTPRWVKVLGLIALVVALLFAITLLVGRGNHGPGRHTPSGEAPSSSVTEPGGQGGHKPPVGGHTP